ncbi:MAG TPA: ABC transporter permease, partial [Candidatus Saccharimonadia bacterium]|nr:ABC transporter permease [Candidatus Saccharimonadia bacterium]
MTAAATVPFKGSRRASGYWRIARHFAARELGERFLGSLSGAAWALLAPVLQLLVLLLVFGIILKVRLPDADPRAFLPFLVAGLWPWVAFSEALMRGMAAIVERAALISKVAMPRSALVLAPVLASFALHGAGFVAVVCVIRALGYPIDLAGHAWARPYWVLLAGFAFGLALALATIRVFVPDAAHVVPQLVSLWFYLTP